MKEALIKNIKSLLNSAELVYSTKDYTSATILFFKLLFCVLDYIIFLKKGDTPKSHSERFRILKEDFPDLYDLIDKYFHIYQQTYSISINKETWHEVRENVKGVIKKYKII